MATVISGTTGITTARVDSVAGVGATPAFLAGQASGTSIPNGAFTKIVFNGENFDTSNAFNATTGEFVVPVTGYYQFSWASGVTASTGSLFTQLMKNGSRIALGSSTNINTLGMVSSGGVLLQCSSGDVLTVQVFQGSGGTVNTDIVSTFFSGFLARAA